MYYEGFEIGRVIRHEIRRTVTEADNVWFSTATCNPAAIHLDEEYCRAHSQFGTRIVNSGFTQGLVVGLSVAGTTVGNLGFDRVRFPAPVFHGDTIRAETEILGKRLSKSRPGQWIVTLCHRGLNQRDELVATMERAAAVLCREAS